MSWDRKDWLKLAGLIGLGATGVGAPLAAKMGGLLGVEAASVAPQAGMLAESVAPQVTEKMAYAANPFIDSLKGAAGAVNKFAKPMMAANQAMNLAQGPQQAPPPPPPPSQFQPTPVNPAYGMGMDSPPPGIDPRQWATMTPDQKRRFKGGY